MKGEIYLIGGGEITTGETKIIDDQLIAASPNGSKLVFFPTAAGDSEEYIHAIETVFSHHFDVIAVTQDKGEEYARKAIESAAVIYLGGGNTALLLQCFDRWQIVPTLHNVLQQGTHIAGMSAGAQALSSLFVNYEKNPFIIEEGWGLADVCCLVHANEAAAQAAFAVYQSSDMSKKC